MRNSPIGVVRLLTAGAVLIAACGESATTIQAPATTTAATQEQVTTTTVEEGPAAVTEAVALLEPIGDSGVSGEALLLWDSDTRILTVTTRLEGVEEGVTYAILIAPGCEAHSGLIYQTGTAVGGADGTAETTAEVVDVDAIDVDGGWGLRVARPPTGEQACGVVEYAP